MTTMLRKSYSPLEISSCNYILLNSKLSVNRLHETFVTETSYKIRIPTTTWEELRIVDELRRSRLFSVAVWMIALLIIGNLLWLLRPVLAQIFEVLEEVLVPLILGLIIAYLLHPIVLLLEKRRVPRLMAVLLIYGSFILLITIAIINAIPVFTKQLVELSDDLPRLMEWYHAWMSEWEAHKYFLPDSISHGVDRVIIQSQEGMSHTVTHLVNRARNSVGKLLAFAVVPFIAFYFLKDMKQLHETGMSIVPKAYRKQVLVVLRDINESLGNYIHGQMIVALIVGLFAYLGYWWIGMPYPFVLASFVCLTNIIPYIGPLIGAAPAVVVAITISTKTLLFVIAVNLIIQIIEGNILSPNIVGRTLHLHPLMIILALLVGETLGGIIGLIVAVPILAVCKVIISRIAVMMHES